MAYTPCYTEVRFFAIIDEFRSTSIFDHPPLFAKSGLVLPSDDSLAVSAALRTSMDRDMIRASTRRNACLALINAALL